MNNIHGIGSSNANNRGGDNRFPMMGGSNDPSGDPRQEGFCKFLKDFCCPTFVFKSVIFFVSIADIIIYFITLLYGIKMSPTELLAPKIETLDMFGMKVKFYFNLFLF